MLVEFAGDGEEFVEECVEVVLQLNIVGREPGDFKQVSEAERFHDSLGVVLVGQGDESVGEVGVFDAVQGDGGRGCPSPQQQVAVFFAVAAPRFAEIVAGDDHIACAHTAGGEQVPGRRELVMASHRDGLCVGDFAVPVNGTVPVVTLQRESTSNFIHHAGRKGALEVFCQCR